MVYNINLEAKLQFSFPIEAEDSEEAERVICELCGMSDGRRDEETKAVLDMVEEFAAERFGRDGEVVCSNLFLTAKVITEQDFLEEHVNSGLLRLHPSEDPILVTPERIHALLENMKDRAVLMEVPGTSCHILYDERCTLKQENEKYLVGALYVVGRSGGYFCMASREELLKMNVIMNNRKVMFDANGEAIPVFKLS